MLGKNRTFTTDCALDAAMSIIEGKWKPMILCKLFIKNGLRFNDLLKEMQGVSPKILTKQLRELEEDGLVARVACVDSPSRSMYTVTPLAIALAPILKDLADWAQKYLMPRLITAERISEPSRKAKVDKAL